MYIPKRNRFEMFLKRKTSTSSNRSNGKVENDNNNWSDICSEFIKEVVLRRRTTLQENANNSEDIDNINILNDPNLCLDQLSEFQKSYISFPEFSDSTNSNESDNESCNTNSVTNGHYWVLSSSSSSSSSS